MADRNGRLRGLIMNAIGKGLTESFDGDGDQGDDRTPVTQVEIEDFVRNNVPGLKPRMLSGLTVREMEIIDHVINRDYEMTDFMAEMSRDAGFRSFVSMCRNYDVLMDMVAFLMDPPRNVYNATFEKFTAFNRDVLDDIKSRKHCLHAVYRPADIDDFRILIRNICKCRRMFGIHNLNWIDTGWVTDMSGLFEQPEPFDRTVRDDVTGETRVIKGIRNSVDFDISLWDVSKVTDMHAMFKNCNHFKGKLGKWSVRGCLTDTHEMFYNCASFNSDISKWHMENVTDTHGMFFGCSSFRPKKLDWNVGKVRDMSMMFTYCSFFNADIDRWDVTAVEDMSAMFMWCLKFDQPLGWWARKIGKVSDMSYMFCNAQRFCSDVSDWDVSGVDDFSHMFDCAFRFSGDLRRWRLSVEDYDSVEDMFNMCPMEGSSLMLPPRYREIMKGEPK